MRCLTDEQLERLVAEPDDPACASLHAHVRQCVACRQKVEHARDDAGLVRDIRELRESRQKVKPLTDEMSRSSQRP